MRSFFAFTVFAAVLIGFLTSHATSQDSPRSRETPSDSNTTGSRSRRSENVARDSPAYETRQLTDWATNLEAEARHPVLRDAPAYGGPDRPTPPRRANADWTDRPVSHPYSPVPIDAAQRAQAFPPVPPRAPQFGRPAAANSDPVTKVVDAIINADSDEVRTDKLEELKAVLENRFDSSLEAQEAELEALETRVQKLRDAVETRRKNRERIISNFLDGISLQAEGLTIPGINQRPMPGLRDPRTFQGRPMRYRNVPPGAPAAIPPVRQPRNQQVR